MCSLRFIKNKCCVQHSGSENEPGHIKEKHFDKLCDIYCDGIGTVRGELVYPAQSYERFIVGSKNCISQGSTLFILEICYNLLDPDDVLNR